MRSGQDQNCPRAGQTRRAADSWSQGQDKILKAGFPTMWSGTNTFVFFTRLSLIDTNFIFLTLLFLCGLLRVFHHRVDSFGVPEACIVFTCSSLSFLVEIVCESFNFGKEMRKNRLVLSSTVQEDHRTAQMNVLGILT